METKTILLIIFSAIYVIGYVYFAGYLYLTKGKWFSYLLLFMWPLIIILAALWAFVVYPIWQELFPISYRRHLDKKEEQYRKNQPTANEIEHLWNKA